MTYIVAFICVIGIAAGQLLFKASANALNQTGSFFHRSTLTMLLAALILYGVTTIGWVWVLQKIELGRVYPLMALAFVFVPMASHYIFGERFQPQYFAGVGMIIVGIIIAVKA